MKNLVIRHLRIFFRDKSNIFFALLSSLIMFMLYTFFLGSIQSENLKDMVMGASNDSVRHFINAWVFSGIITITAITTSLGAFNIFVEDRVHGRFNDFAVSPVPKWKLVISYMLAAVIISTSLTTLVAAGSVLYLSITGVDLMTFQNGVELLAKILFLSIVFSSLASALATGIKSTSAFTSLGVIVGTSVGFLAGVYVPIGSLPAGVANVMNILPFSQAAALIREPFAAESLNQVSTNNQVLETLHNTYGFTIAIGGNNLANNTVIAILCSLAAILVLFAVLRIRKILN